MDDFTQFQIKEYENISQAHFKTNEVLATFYRYYLLIVAIPITTVAIALINLAGEEISGEARILAYVIFAISAVVLSLVGAAIIAYIEGLRLDAILYARTVNSIRDFFFRKSGADEFGIPVLPRDSTKPKYGGFGAGALIYFACAALNSAIFASGILVFSLNRSVPLTELAMSTCVWISSSLSFLFLLAVQAVIRFVLIRIR